MFAWSINNIRKLLKIKKREEEQDEIKRSTHNKAQIKQTTGCVLMFLSTATADYKYQWEPIQE